MNRGTRRKEGGRIQGREGRREGEYRDVKEGGRVNTGT